MSSAIRVVSPLRSFTTQSRPRSPSVGGLCFVSYRATNPWSQGPSSVPTGILCSSTTTSPLFRGEACALSGGEMRQPGSCPRYFLDRLQSVGRAGIGNSELVNKWKRCLAGLLVAIGAGAWQKASDGTTKPALRRKWVSRGQGRPNDGGSWRSNMTSSPPGSGECNSQRSGWRRC
jgi:hypothetical protein